MHALDKAETLDREGECVMKSPMNDHTLLAQIMLIVVISLAGANKTSEECVVL